MSISCVSHSGRLASLPDSVLAIVLRDLPREVLLRLRLVRHDVCNRLSKLLSNDAICFERRLRMPASLDDVPDMAAFLRGLCDRFGIIKNNTWCLRIDVRVQMDGDNYLFSCSRMITSSSSTVIFSALVTK